MVKQIKRLFWKRDTNEIVTIYEQPHNEIKAAINYVNMAVDGKVGFCYDRVRKYPLSTRILIKGSNVIINDYRNEIERLKKEKIAAFTTSDRSRVITTEIAKLKEKEVWLYDQTTYNRMKKEFAGLKKALKLLYDHGEINSYNIMPNGRLTVEWFTERKKHFRYTVIEQGFTYVVFRDEAPTDVNVIHVHTVPVITVQEIMHRHREKLPQIGMADAVKQTDLHNHLSHKNAGDYTITDSVGNVVRRYSDRKAGGEYKHKAPVIPIYKEDMLCPPIEDTSQDVIQWRYNAMIAYQTEEIKKGIRVSCYV